MGTGSWRAAPSAAPARGPTTLANACRQRTPSEPRSHAALVHASAARGRSAIASVYAKGQPSPRLSCRAASASRIAAQPLSPQSSIATYTPQPEPQQSIARQAQRGPRTSASQSTRRASVGPATLTTRAQERGGSQSSGRLVTGPGYVFPRDGGKAWASRPGRAASARIG